MTVVSGSSSTTGMIPATPCLMIFVITLLFILTTVLPIKGSFAPPVSAPPKFCLISFVLLIASGFIAHRLWAPPLLTKPRTRSPPLPRRPVCPYRHRLFLWEAACYSCCTDSSRGKPPVFILKIDSSRGKPFTAAPLLTPVGASPKCRTLAVTRTPLC